ncbi:MAG: hypothetical protein GX060_06755 [Firmicutes bacterium]|nr:hypothetical protein [Bacillota bacterium]
MRIIVSHHAVRRLQNLRQMGITVADVRKAANRIPGKIPVATRFRWCRAQSGREFDLVVKDIANGRLIITVIGK